MNKVVEAKVLHIEDNNLQIKVGQELVNCILAAEERPVVLDTKYIFFLWQTDNEIIYASRRLPEIDYPNFAIMEVIGHHPNGYIVDWGRKPNLTADCENELDVGKDYVFYIYADEKESLVASGDYRDFFEEHTDELQKNDEVDILIYTETDLGVKCIVNNKYEGLLYHNQIFVDYYRGERRKAFVNNVREDGKLDIIFQQNRWNVRDENSKTILEYIEENGGEMEFTDKSDPHLISKVFGMSKKAFKRALGNLYKDKVVLLEKSKTILNNGKRN